MLFGFSKVRLFSYLMFVVIIFDIVGVILTIHYATQSEINVISLFQSYMLYLNAWQNDDELYSNIKNASCNIIDIRSHKISTQTDDICLEANKCLETSVKCIGDLHNQSCLYKNLYYVDSTFWILSVKGRNLPRVGVRIDAFVMHEFFPNICEFDTDEKLHNFVRNIADPKVIPGVTVYFSQPWHFNIGHALFDGLYPAYVALIRFTSRHLHPFRLLVDIDECKDCWSENVYARFAGLGIIKQSILNRMSAGRWFVFDELVMGSGLMCQRCMQPNLQLPGSIELNGSRLFRDRMYAQHGLTSAVTRRKHSAESRELRGILNAFIINNKRFTFADRREIRDAINELNKYTDEYLNDTNSNISKLEWPRIRVFYVYYGHIKAGDRHSQQPHVPQVDIWMPTYELTENNFMAQLRLLRKIDIHVTGPGTGQMYQPFLSDGAVNINLGGLRPAGMEKTRTAYASFLEQHMTAGTPYIKGLYYPINERSKGIKKDEVIKLIRNAGKLILEGFSIPVNPKDNLAADGQLFIDMCEKDQNFCKLVTKRSANTNANCIDAWVEDIVHEHRQWNTGGFNDTGKNVSCLFNHTLLHELRQKYGIHHYQS